MQFIGVERFGKVFLGTLIPQHLRLWQQVSSNSDIVADKPFLIEMEALQEP